MFGWFKKKNKNSNDYVDEQGVVTKSALTYDDDKQRFLRLANSDCAIVLHENSKIEVIFTKAYDVSSQNITESEEELMAIACFMKQPGFLNMIVDEFRKIASTKISSLTDNMTEEGDDKK